MSHSNGTSTVGCRGSSVGRPSVEPRVENRDSGTDSGWVSRSSGSTGMALRTGPSALRSDGGSWSTASFTAPPRSPMGAGRLVVTSAWGVR